MQRSVDLFSERHVEKGLLYLYERLLGLKAIDQDTVWISRILADGLASFQRLLRYVDIECEVGDTP